MALAMQGELLARLVVGTLLGALIGYERQVHGRPAGGPARAPSTAYRSRSFRAASARIVCIARVS